MTTAVDLELSITPMSYDITRPLLDGQVKVDGVTFKPTRGLGATPPPDSPLKTGDFGLCDLNIGYVFAAIDAGWEIVGLPVFAKRKPVYQYVVARTDRGIEGVKDLEGKRIVTRSYKSSIAVWLRGLLRHRHGVDVSTMQWLVVDEEPWFPIHNPNARIEVASGDRKGAWERLLDGEADAMLGDISDASIFQALKSDTRVKRLFPTYWQEDERLYREEGVYTPVHMMVMSRKLDRERPELARRLYDAFEESKRVAYEQILNDRAGFGVMYLREQAEEQFASWGDPWKYGLRANQSTFDALQRDNAEQGLTRDVLSIDRLIASGTLDT